MKLPAFAHSLRFKLLVATVLTLVLLPVLYVAVFGAATGRSGAKRPANAGGTLS